MVSRVLQRKRGLGATSAGRLAKAAGVRPEYLLLIDDVMLPATLSPMEREAARASADEERVAIPRLLRIAAGVPEFSPLDGRQKVITDRRTLQKLVGPIPDDDPQRVVFAASVHGDSMAPGIADGDTLIVQRYTPPTRAEIQAGRPLIESGKVYVLNLSAADDDTDEDAKASVKRLVLSTGHELIVLSDNTKYPPRVIDLRHVRLVQGLILGRPVKLIRELQN